MGNSNNRQTNEALPAPRFPGVRREVAAQVAIGDLALLDAALRVVEAAPIISEEPPRNPPLAPHLVQEPWRDQQAA